MPEIVFRYAEGNFFGQTDSVTSVPGRGSGTSERRFIAMIMPPWLNEVSFSLQAGKVDSGDTAWVLASAALVMIITPALAFFYGGMVRKKNVLGTIMQSFI